MNQVDEKNQKYFADVVDDYKVSYLREDEERLVDSYFRPNATLLVLGCGAGRTLRPLHEKGFRITAIDVVPEMVEAAKLSVKDLPIEISHMDATKMDFDNDSFDAVLFPFHGIDYVYPDIYICVKEVCRVLKEGGVFIFNSHNRFFLKEIAALKDGKYSNYHGLVTYRSTFWDYFKLKKHFKKVKMIQRISLIRWKNSNFRDKCYKLLPFLNKSTYFIGIEPRKKQQ